MPRPRTIVGNTELLAKLESLERKLSAIAAAQDTPKTLAEWEKEKGFSAQWLRDNLSEIRHSRPGGKLIMIRPSDMDAFLSRNTMEPTGPLAKEAERKAIVAGYAGNNRLVPQ